MKLSIKNPKLPSYLGLAMVVLVWGSAPLFTLKLYEYYSPTIRLFFSETVLVITYLIISGKRIKDFNMNYIKVGIPTGLFLAFANITQKIGLFYTTPTKYAFLENLSCITVPITLFILTGKKIKPHVMLSCIICFLGVFILSGTFADDTSSLGLGEILCGAAGLLYGFNIAGTGLYAKKLYAPLYLAVQSTVGMITSLAFALVLNSVTSPLSGNTVPLEKLVFSFDPRHMLFVILVAVITSSICWIIRTNSMKHIDASVVAVISPFSAVITGILSVITGSDTLNINLILGGVLVLGSIFMSSYDDIFHKATD